MGHSPDLSPEAQDAGARVFDCMLREADDLLEEAQAEWFLAADHPEAAREGLRATGFLAAVGVWLASMRSDPVCGLRLGLSPILPPPRDPETAEDPALERLRAVGARAGRLYERAARLDGLLSGREEQAAAPLAPPSAPPRPDLTRPAALPASERAAPRREALAKPIPRIRGKAAARAAQKPAPKTAQEARPDARSRQIWLSEALSAEAWA